MARPLTGWYEGYDELRLTDQGQLTDGRHARLPGSVTVASQAWPGAYP
jgi:hypothetical protein